jgi:biotin-(acetyl-CoA carboxylase) ligase
MASALVALEALLERSPELPLTLKWPNDLWLKGRKLGGLLCESVSVGGKEPFLILGLGLNVQHAPTGLDQETASLKEFDGESGPEVLESLRKLLSHRITEACNRLDAEGGSWVEALFWKHSHFAKGSAICWQDPRTVHALQSGEVSGLGSHGELRVKQEGRVVSLYAEEIRALRSGDG